MDYLSTLNGNLQIRDDIHLTQPMVLNLLWGISVSLDYIIIITCLFSEFVDLFRYLCRVCGLASVFVLFRNTVFHSRALVFC